MWWTIRRAAVAMILAGSIAGGCTSGSGAEAPERAAVPSSPSTTTTTSVTTSITTVPTTEVEGTRFEPLIADPALPIRDQVEAAYLFHWEVLLDALRTGSTDSLALVYTGSMLELRVQEIEGLTSAGERGKGDVEHNYEISVLAEDYAVVVDGYRNHLIRVDATSGEPLEEPTGEEVVYEYQMRRFDDRWLVAHVVRYRFSE